MVKDVVFKEVLEKEKAEEEAKFKVNEGQEVITEPKLNESAKNIADLFSLNDIKEHYEKLNDQAVEHLSIESDLYDDIYKMSTKLKKSTSGTKLQTFDKLSRDIFLSLFKYKPVVKKVDEMTPATEINNKILRELVKTDEFKKLRQSCTLDELSSSLGTTIFNEKAKVIIEEWVNKNEQNSNNMDTISKMVKEQNKLDNALRQNNQNKANNCNQNLQNLKNELNSNNKGSLEGLGRSLGKAAGEANKDVKEANDMMDSWGFGEGDDSKRISYKDKKQAIEKIRASEKLKKMTELVGRFKDTALKDLKRKSTQNGHIIKSVTTGDDITKTLQTEKGRLLNPVTKKDFYKRYTEKQLLQYECENDYMKSKGPILFLNDGSGSMSGDKEIWSKAVAIAMLEIAHKEHRDFAYILFNSFVNMVVEIPKNTFDTKKVLDIAEKFPGGGTEFEPPLQEALEMIQKSKYKKADIVFVTDGESHISDDFLRKFNNTKTNKEFKVLGVCVDIGGRTNIRVMNTICDDVTTVKELTSLESNSELTHKIFKFGR